MSGPLELGRYPARCKGCNHEVDVVIVVDLTAVEERLARIERAVTSLKGEIMSDVNELDAELTGIEAAQATEQATEDKVLADLEAKEQSGAITDEERTRLEAIRATAVAQTTELEAADAPAPAPVDGTPVDGGSEPAPAE